MITGIFVTRLCIHCDNRISPVRVTSTEETVQTCACSLLVVATAVHALIISIWLLMVEPVYPTVQLVNLSVKTTNASLDFGNAMLKMTVGMEAMRELSVLSGNVDQVRNKQKKSSKLKKIYIIDRILCLIVFESWRYINIPARRFHLQTSKKVVYLLWSWIIIIQ